MNKTVIRAITTDNKQKSLGILGVPFAKGQGKEGVDLAPEYLRKNGLVDILKNISKGNLLVKDYGNLQCNTINAQPQENHLHNMKNFGDFFIYSQALIAKVSEILKHNDQFLTIGGDHAIGFGSVAGHLQRTPNLTVVWIDAHPDVNLNTTSSSGNIHGMPVALLLRELRADWPDLKLFELAPVCLDADQLIYIGVRDIDPYEAYIMQKLGIRAYGMDSIEKYGIDKIIEMTLDAIKPQNKIHISFDIDALDVTVAPSTGTAVHAGMTLREGIRVLEALRDTGRVEGCDLVEVNPLLGSQQEVKQTIAVALELLKHVFGHKRSEYFDESLKDSTSTQI